MEDFTKQDEAYRAYQKGFAAGVKAVTDNPVGHKVSLTGKNPNCKYGRYDCMPCTNCNAYIPTMTNADRIRV